MGEGRIPTDVAGGGGKQCEMSCHVSNANFSLTLIVKLEMDSSGGKIWTPKCNEMTFFKNLS